MTRHIIQSIGFIDYHNLAINRRAKDLLRERMKIQLSPTPTDEEITKLSVKDAIKIKKQMDAAAFSQSATCSMISDNADGMNVPFHISLGKPIRYNSEVEIPELIFQAANFGAVEDIVALDNELEQTAALLLIAEPILVAVGADLDKPAGSTPVAVPTLLTLPAALASKISVADGLWIMENVTRPFFATDENS